MDSSVRNNAFNFMLMKKEFTMCLKLRSQITELDNKNEQFYSHCVGESHTFLFVAGQPRKIQKISLGLVHSLTLIIIEIALPFNKTENQLASASIWR